MLEEMVRARDFVVMDGDALLRAQFVDQFLDRARRHDFVLSARDDDARRGAGGQEAEIIHVRRRRERQKAANLGPPPQKLHSERSKDRRVWTEGVSTCRSLCTPLL